MDSDKNGEIRYYLERPVPGFAIAEQTGALYVNSSQLSENFSRDAQLYVAAVDSGIPPLKSVASVRVRVQYRERLRPHLIQNQYRSILMEDSTIGTVILTLSNENKFDASSFIEFQITSGNENNTFDILQPNNALVLVKKMDRETTQSYNLRLIMADKEMAIGSDNSSTVNVFVIVDDVNDNAPVFDRNEYTATISESAGIKYTIGRVRASDADLESSPNSEVVYSISSGNDVGLFSVDLISGVLSVNGALDYDQGPTSHNLTIRACDSGAVSLCSISSFNIKLTDENDNEPFFPLSQYIEFIAENEPISASVFTARAVDLDRGIYGKLNYSILQTLNGEDGSTNFSVEAKTGILRTNAVLDYEQKNSYAFVLKATDTGGKFALIKVKILIESRDEYSPQFTDRIYRFSLPTSGSEALPIGYTVGHVTATDMDSGIDGQVIYQLTAQHPYFKINRTTGAILLKKKLDNAAATPEDGHDISLVVIASSGRQGSLTNTTVVEIALDPLTDIETNLASSGNSKDNGLKGFADWAIGLLISFILLVTTFSAVFISIHIRNRRHRQVMKPNLSSETVGGSSNSYVDPSIFDTMPIRSSANSVSGAAITSTEQFAPPKYDEIPPYRMHSSSSNSGNATTSELSGSERSGSSGHGSAEDDGDDEEIRMINEGSLEIDGSHEDGRISNSSIQNTQEYLARLGIIDNVAGIGAASTSSRLCAESVCVSSTKDTMLQHGLPIDTLNIFDEEQNENDISNLIYAKLNGAAESENGSHVDDSATSASNIGNTVDHVMMGTYSNHPVIGVGGTAGPSMTGSLSSIVHSEEELTGSYNWDYLLDWGPQYQPLAHVFSEIARLKDDSISLHSGNSGASSGKSKMSLQQTKNLPPPLLTNIAPRSVPVLSARGSHNSHIGSMNQYLLPRSPISHDASVGFSTSSAMSPSFSPSLSPLATRSPSISPHVPPTGRHLPSMPRHQMPPTRRKQFNSNHRLHM